MQTNQSTTEKLTETEMDLKFKEYAKKTKLSYPVMILGVICSIIGFSINSRLIIIVGIVIVIFGFAYITNIKSKAKENLSSQITRTALEEIFDDVNYLPTCRINDFGINQSDMDFPFSYNRIEGSDYVQCTYNGVGVELSDITLKNVTRTIDSNGHSHENETIHFRGLWLICDFGKELSSDLRLSEKRGFLQKHFSKGINTENEAFNNKFKITSKDEHTAFYILTPHMMEYIIQMDEKGDGDTYMSFLREGKLHLAISNDQDLFEIGSISKANTADLKAKFASQTKYICDLIDELRLSDTLYKK